MITNDFGHPIVKGTIDKRMKMQACVSQEGIFICMVKKIWEKINANSKVVIYKTRLQSSNAYILDYMGYPKNN